MNSCSCFYCVYICRYFSPYLSKPIKNGYTFYDWAMRMGGVPAFWARPISGENALTAEEAAALHERRCKVLPLFDGFTELSISSRDGAADALRAAQAAKAIGVPADGGVALFANIPSDWSVNHNWMISFAHTVAANGYRQGFIGNTDSSLNFNFDRQLSHYVQATQEVGEIGALYGATEPKGDRVAGDGEPEAWAPFCPSALQTEDMCLWRRGGGMSFDGMTVGSLYARDKSVLDAMW